MKPETIERLREAGRYNGDQWAYYQPLASFAREILELEGISIEESEVANGQRR